MTTTQFDIGATFAGYRIEAEIGRGGMGVVYRATEISLERPVALKLITPELASEDDFRNRFLRESRIAASLDHPHVLPVFSAGEVDGQLYLAMRYVEGEDLKTLLAREGRLESERALRICSQVAEALDAAHSRGLVHRDLKPANVLLDSSGEAYLSDFGLTKQVGSASTETGRLVGTLDYLAPEQIRGEAVDARSDEYALACVLYECLEREPPFHRQTEAELLWAHLQEDAPPLPGHPELDPVFSRALAKEKGERYESAGGFCDAAGQALGLETPRLRRRRKLLRRSRVLIAAGALVLAGAAAVIAVEVTNGSSRPKTVGNAVGAIDATSGRLVSYTPTGTTPSNVVFGGGSIWVLNADDRTISELDPDTRRLVTTFGTGGLPTDLAYGNGSLWVGNGTVPPGGWAAFTSSVVRIDPQTHHVTASVALPRKPAGSPTFGAPGANRLAVTGGSVWAVNPDAMSLSRIDATTAHIVSRIPVPYATAVTAGRDGVWVANAGVKGPEVSRIDARTGRLARSIPVPTGSFGGIATGDGSVWETDPEGGTVWRIETRPHPILKTIPIGYGVAFVAFSRGAVWTANPVDGTVSRIDPATNSVTSTTPVAGTSQGLAVGGGLAWATTAGGSQDGTLPVSACSKVESGGRSPDVLVASDLPLQGSSDEQTQPMAAAIRFVLRRHDFRAGKYTVGYQSCDDSTAQAGGATFFKCASNAKAYSQAAQLVALIGTYNSSCASTELPIVNRAPLGGVPMISPSNTDTGLTRPGPNMPQEMPEANYPTGVRNYLRLVSPDDLQSAADAVFAKRLGVRSVYVVDDVDGGFTRAARRIGLRVAGSWTPASSPAGPSALATTISRSGADGVFIGARILYPGTAEANAFQTLRARLGRGVAIILTDQWETVSDLLKATGPSVVGTYMSNGGLGDLGAPGRRFMRGFAAAQPGGVTPPLADSYLPYTAEAAELVLRAIARSDGTRASVLHELRTIRETNGIVGSFRFDRNGDVTPARVTIFRITGNTPRGSHLIREFHGAVVDRVISIPTTLIGG
ncbi:MAG TPA: protein kinase [Gaiellaceae bacterium]|nr:protein kinase [Gaiellaceae bacterium]